MALVCDWFHPRHGGIELHLRDLALALRERGLDARVVTTTPGPDSVNGIPVHRMAAPRAPIVGVAISPTLRGRLRTLIEHESLDVVHAHASVVSPLAYAAAMAGADTGRQTVLTFHSMLFKTSFLLGAADALFGWRRRGVTLTAVSSVVARQAARWLPEAQIGILPNGIDTSFWQPSHETRESKEIVFVTAMRLGSKKRPERLLRAFAEALRFTGGIPPLRLIIAGSGSQGALLRRRAAELGIEQSVEFAGQLTRHELLARYRQADIFVLPSERESFGIAALEARAAGLPVLAMLDGGTRDFIVPGVNGLLARDQRELARFMARLALDEPLRRYLSFRNRTPPVDYDWRSVAALHERFYQISAPPS